MKKLLLLGLFLVAPCYANGVPTWSTGSSNRTENTTQTITRSIVTQKYGSALETREASNISVTSSSNGGITHTDAIFTTNTANAVPALGVKHPDAVIFVVVAGVGPPTVCVGPIIPPLAIADYLLRVVYDFI